MDERDFELLEVLNRTKNITHAADLLYTTQSALSKRIAAIEQDIGTSIMLRSRQGIHFTPAGEIALEHARKATLQLQQMREEIEHSRGHICGTLNAGISINYALYKLPDLLVQYRKRYPYVNTHIVTDQSRKIYLQALNGSVDAAIVRGEFPWKENRILLERENICAICCNEHKHLSLQDIPYIGRKTDSVFERELAQWMRENNIHIKPNGIFVDNIVTCVEMVSRGLGWAVVPEICIRNFDGCIRPLIFENGEPFVRSTYLIYTENAKKLPQAEAFIDIVRNESKGV